MSFGENVGYYRKRLGITQEELAERLYVSRQTVSRWETDSTFPDVEMLIRLCELFGCDMDTLVRKDAKVANGQAERSPESPSVDLSTYDKHMNGFAFWVALGVGLIVFGVALLFFFIAWNKELIGLVGLFICIATAVADFIVSGIGHGNFMRENPVMAEYPEEKRKAALKKMPWLIAASTVLIFVGVILLLVMLYSEQYLTVEDWEYFSVAVFMSVISVSVFGYVYAGSLYSKYNVKAYNEECVKEGFAKAEENGETGKGKKISETISSVIMMAATVIFLLCGFIGNLWHPAWVVFPVGGILCGIVSVIVEAVFKK
ncbi:MAG: helix-turn-helix domain-containing protein [Clostridia bacterium]|nr:helix-turn-helix domain-containing protein [Clostridia bacterium]